MRGKRFRDFLYSHKKSVVVASIIVFLVLVLTISFSFAAPLEDDVKVEENSELTYYIDVTYDGKDGEAITSSDSATSQVYSDYIYVEDKIPDGLLFQGFIETDDGTIGAVKRSDNSFCAGYVEDGVDGLHYNSSTRTVSFRVKNLQAGCKITVGIRTMTPSLGDKMRMDFYNTAYGREGSMSVKSNTVHVFMGRESVTSYNVSYQYTGTVPEGAPEVPPTSSYVSGSTVGVSQDVHVDGYVFSGWSTSDVTVTNKSFTMPSKNVTFRGSFRKDTSPTYEVSYTIDGDVPEGYLPPTDKNYVSGADVKLDSLKVGDIINGYRFLGWTTSDVELPDTSVDDSVIFEMPPKNVSIVGKFERVSYTVSYEFQGNVVPPNADSLLPTEKEYYPGDTVSVASNPKASGYQFLGWYSSDEFVMPEEDVVIYGEWSRVTGTFSPTITKTIANKKSFYQNGDVVNFNITVSNTASFPIKDVILEELTEGSKFISGSGYTVLNDQYIKIPTIPANGGVNVLAQYEVGNDSVKNVTNVVQLTGAIADNNYFLDTSKEYKAEVSFVVSNLSLKINKTDEEGNPITGAEFSLSKGNNFYETVASQAVMDNVSSEFVSSSRGIDFSKASSDTNGKGVYTRAGTENDSYPIHYYRGDVDNNHVKFAGYCWKAVRTTETGGVKLIYDGVPDSNGYCNNTGTSSQIGSSAFNTNYGTVADVGYMIGNRYDFSSKEIEPRTWYEYFNFTLQTRDKMSSTNLYYSDSVIYTPRPTYTLNNPQQFLWKSNYSNLKGKYTHFSSFSSYVSGTVSYIINTSEDSVDYISLAHGTVDDFLNQLDAKTWIFGNDVSWDGSTYTLKNTVKTSNMGWNSKEEVENGHHYTCFSASNTCDQVYYVFYSDNVSTSNELQYYTLTNGKTIDNILEEMVISTSNTTDSTIKNKIDDWYKNNMDSYSNYIEDTVWCNERSVYEKNGWDKDDNSLNETVYFGISNRDSSSYNPQMSCINKNDAFTVNSDSGNQKLTYPVGLLTADEILLAGKSDNYLDTGQMWWTMTPYYYKFGNLASGYLYQDKLKSYSNYGVIGVRPSISLNSNTTTVKGNGSSNSPYEVSLSSDEEENKPGTAFVGLEPNTTYYLREVRAPSGYQLLGESLEVKVDSNGNVTVDGYEVDNNNGVATVTIPNKKINVLPNTGGVGVVPYVVLGLILVGGGSLYFIYFIRKRGDKNEKNHK